MYLDSTDLLGFDKSNYPSLTLKIWFELFDVRMCEVLGGVMCKNILTTSKKKNASMS